MMMINFHFLPLFLSLSLSFGKLKMLTFVEVFTHGGGGGEVGEAAKKVFSPTQQLPLGI